jgi:chromosome segregation ATPase
MSTVHKIREEIDNKLDILEKQVAAMEAQLEQHEEVAGERIETQKKLFCDALDQFKTKVDQSRVVAEEKKWKIKSQLEELKLQLALGKAETKDALEEQKEKIKQAIKSFESTVDEGIEEISEEFDEAKSELVKKADTVNAELEALGLRLKGEKEKWEIHIEERKKELSRKLQSLREELKEKKHIAKDKAAVFEKEVSSAMSKLKEAFCRLFSKKEK